ncbi:Sterol O-acyltransferase 1 [Eumeta japonica]|uniref:Sterol O-acyltransferase 1 n=1 Tax=Eumeta variegata TaxID=151549 RepID=A0A4C1U7T4_EUMVA|nr:Sterol O-acyltransferase 1 [Eumeta japonica]
MLRDMFACVLPSVLAFLCGFYCLLHSWFNAFAEMLTFADRLFYEDWWTQSQYSHFYRSWNLVVHTWLREYIYKPLSPRTGKMFATLTVFLVSALAHEVVLAASFGFFYPVLFVEFGVIGLLVVPLTAVGGRRHPDFYNFLIWLSFFVGNGLMWSLYPMEHFARQNCAPAETDSFFVPKSWSCPRVVIKPNWTFHNPFSLGN